MRATGDLFGGTACAVAVRAAVSDLGRSREFYAGRLGLRVLDADRRRVVCDAGPILLGLVADGTSQACPDSVELVCPVGRLEAGRIVRLRDPDGLRLTLYGPSDGRPSVTLRWIVPDPRASRRFHERLLGLRVLAAAAPDVEYAAGGLRVATRPGARGDGAPRVVPVFQVADVGSAAAALARSGVEVREADSPAFAGPAARIDAPSGHGVHLWQLPREGLPGETGRRILDILGAPL